MGSRTVEDLANAADVEQLTIADRNAPEAERLAQKLSGAPASVQTRQVDANDHADLVAAIKGHDVVASAVGPFHRFEAKMVRASIEAGADYVSICDEWEAVEEVLRDESDAAERAGRIVVTGCGASPGFTNVGVRHMADEMDHVKRAHVYVYQPLDAGGGEAVFKHMLYIMSGKVAVWRDGARQMIPACSETRTVEFPRFGFIDLWNMGHSEPYTIPRFISGIEEVSFFMGYGKGASLVVKPAQWGWFSTPRWIDRFAWVIDRIDRLSPDAPAGIGAIRIDVWGERDGKPVKRMACGTGEMREATGLALSVGALMLGRRELLTEKGGVYAPEACIRPLPFIEAMREKGVLVYEDLDMKTPF